MENRAEDYYDIPSELLPTPNFANRPMIEISMLDGMMFMMFSSSSSSEDEEDTTAQPQSRDKLVEWTLSRPELPERPRITITAPSEEDSRPLSSSFSGDVIIVDRSPLRKAHSAPAGALRPPKAIPPQPRRAISERMGLLKTVKGMVPQYTPLDRSPWACRRILGDEPAEPRRPLPPVPVQTEHMVILQDIGGNEQANSFSRKARVKETIERKQMEMLNTDNVELELRRSPNTPNSILSTPRELYAFSKQQLATDPLPNPRSHDRKSIISTSASTHSPSEVSDIPSRNEEVHHVSRDAYLLRQKRVYLPGPIRLEEHPTKPRIDSVTNTDLFDSSLATKPNRFSDMVALDGIVMFFEDFGVVDQVTEEALDKYWLDDSSKDPFVGTNSRTRIASVEETASKSPRKAQSHRVSKFSFSSASSSASMHPLGVAKRQKIRLRRLLSPALPGSTFLKTPANWGKQTGNS